MLDDDLINELRCVDPMSMGDPAVYRALAELQAWAVDRSADPEDVADASMYAARAIQNALEALEEQYRLVLACTQFAIDAVEREAG